MNHRISRIYIIKPYCDKSSQQLIDYLIKTHKNIVKAAKITAEIKDNIKNDRKLLHKLRRISTRFNMISKQLDGQIDTAVKSQDKCLNTANRVLNKHFASLIFKVFVNSIKDLKADIDHLKIKISIKSKDNDYAE